MFFGSWGQRIAPTIITFLLATTLGNFAFANLCREELKAASLEVSSFSGVSPDDFLSAIEKVPPSPYLRRRSLEEYTDIVSQGGQLYLAHDRSSGYGITQEGLLFSFFKSQSTKGLGARALRDAINRGATSLVCVDTPFPRDYYASHGFEVSKRFAMSPQNAGYDYDWPEGRRPNMVIMRLRTERSFSVEAPLSR